MNTSTPSIVGRRGVGTLRIFAEHPERVLATADQFCYIDRKGLMRRCSDRRIGMEARRLAQLHPQQVAQTGLVLLRHHNAYVTTGLNNSLDREFGLGGTAIGYIGVSSNTTAVTAATVYLNGAAAGAAANTIIKAISPAATRSAQTVTGGATFANADFTGGVFAWAKIGFLATSTDAGTGLIDVIGGTGGTAPYNRSFSLDLTAAGTFSVVAQIAVTAVAV